MVVYSDQEKLEIIPIYRECQRNSTASQRLYRDRFPNKPVCPLRQNVYKIGEKFSRNWMF
jgi:hypothetical protein